MRTTKQSIPRRLRDIRNRIEKIVEELAAIRVDERRVNKHAAMLREMAALVYPTNSMVLDIARGIVVTRTYRATQEMIDAGLELFALCVEVDRCTTLSERLDLLSAGRRPVEVAEGATFAELLGGPLEVPAGRRNRRAGPLWLAATIATTPDVYSKQAALKPLVDEFERRQAAELADRQARDELISQAWVAARIAAAGGVHKGPSTLQ